MSPDFAEFLAQYEARSSAPGADRIRTFWAAAELEIHSHHERDTFTWISWPTNGAVPEQVGSTLGPIERYSWAICERGGAPPWVVDDRSHNAWYWSHIVQQVLRLRFLLKTKLYTLLTGVERAIVECDPLVTALLLRSFFENTATLYALRVLLKERLNGFDVERLATVRVIDEALQEQLSGFFCGTRFNWDALSRGDFGSWSAKPELSRNSAPRPLPQILNHIDLVSKDPQYSAFRHMYAWLCEFVHPNVGSHLIYLRSANIVHNRIVIGFSSSATRDEFALFLEPFVGSVCCCLQIIVETIPQLKSFLRPLDDWCRTASQDYF